MTNWISKFIKPKIKALFKKKASSAEGLFGFHASVKFNLQEDFNLNYNCCTKCGAHHKLSCVERFKLFFDNGVYETIKTPIPKDDPLNFIDNKKYVDRLKSARKTGQDDAILIAKGKVKSIEVTVGAQDFRFIGGSFGAASGEAFIAGVQHAIDNKTPYIFLAVVEAKE